METTVKTNKYDRKLAEILSAAAQVFAAEGYDRASIRMVADRAGVSVAGLYYYVKGKEELLYLIQYHAFFSLVEQYKAARETVDSPEAQLELLIRGHLEHFLPNLAELAVCSREINRLTGNLRKKVEAQQRKYFRLALEVFNTLAETHGGTRVEPRAAALSMFGTINWIHTWYRPRSGPSAAKMAEDFTRLYLRGVLPD